MTGIYIHVPFCAKKCPYCDFYSCLYTLKSARKYTDAVLRNIPALPELSADTVYFGGGTPSILPPELLAEILDSISENVRLIMPEITVEVNPCTVTEKKLDAYKEMGVNRLSFGVQSGNNDELAFLGRKHSFEKAAEMVEAAHDMGFENISCDVMIGVKDQTAEKLENSIKKIAKLPIKHISSYILKVEENTDFGRNNTAAVLPDDDSVSDLYLHSVKILEQEGFRQYEISNFSKQGYESRHNLKYWKCEEYIGIGPSSHSYYNGKRCYVPEGLEKFCDNEYQEIVYEDYEAGTDEEKIMLGMRLSDGIFLDDFPDKKSGICQKAEKYCSHGLAFISDGRLRLTPEGFLVSNLIIADLVCL